VVVRGGTAVCSAAGGNPSSAVRDLLHWAVANNLGDLEDLSVESPTLEDAYLHLVAGGTR
jgi:hypothetical protein